VAAQCTVDWTLPFSAASVLNSLAGQKSKMNTKRKIVIMWLVGSLLLAGCGKQSSEDLDLSEYFSKRGVVGSFLFYDENGDHFIRYCQNRCSQRFIPASTFKLLNAQIALETGVIKDENEVIPWDGTDWKINSWNQDQNLRTAMQDSVVWFYQELARRIGRERMQEYVDLVGYGNLDISGSSDVFWLEGNLRISQEEQIAFLERLYHEALPFSEETMKTVINIIVLEETPVYRLSGKTGWATSVNPDVGWFVGYVEKGGNVYYFATNVNLEGSVESLGKISQAITMEILAAMGILDQRQG
jgi:beta-lactamase class D